jgi:hypothetical protein
MAGEVAFQVGIVDQDGAAQVNRNLPTGSGLRCG